MNVRRLLGERIGEAMRTAGAPHEAGAMVTPSARPQFGDYQANGVMAAAKEAKTQPRKLAEKVVEELDLSGIAETVEVAGPGFINVTLDADWLAGQVAGALVDERLGVEPAAHPQTVVVDYSHPNLAKEMHVGHLRSTIIGDAIVRTLDMLGHNVIRQNHVGDWGTQFGMILAYMDRLAAEGTDVGTRLEDLNRLYQQANALFHSDPAFADAARQAVVRLQGGDRHYRQLWDRFIEESLRHCEEVYRRLNVTLRREHVRGESAYNADLPRVIEDLRKAGLLTESQGADCVFLDEFTNAKGEPLPVIVRKSDGAYLYATTDLAALRYRAGELGADRVLYIVDARQTLHLRQVFAVARAAGFVGDDCALEHHPFGTMMGADGKPFRTREGGTVKLTDLLDEAVARARRIVEEKNPDLGEAEKDRVAEAVGVGAVKYADLSQNRMSDYVFEFDRMLSLEGNTAPYMQYAYARVRSIFRRGERDVGRQEPAGRTEAALRIEHPRERQLAIRLLQFAENVQMVADDCLPNALCTYLFELAGTFMSFYESCPVLKADEPTRTSRLLLCELTARTIRTGLDLLGIETPEQM